MSEPEIWIIKMADHPQDDFVRLSAYKALDLQRAELMVENARLKAEVERLTAEVSYDNRVQLHVDKLAAEFTQSEVERLKAEVERLESMADENAHLHKGIYSLSLNVVQLKDEVERLRKAGDAMADAAYAHCMCQDCEELRDQWRDAKRGKQP